jgi:hypothetical protein
MESAEILQKILQVVESNRGIDGWTDLAVIGKPLTRLGVDYRIMGYAKLRELLITFPDDLELRRDDSRQVPVLYVRPKKVQLPEVQTVTPTTTFGAEYNDAPLIKRSDVANNIRIPSKLTNWAYMGDFRNMTQALKDMALKERWYYKTQDPTNPYPILYSYLVYTFYRLSKEPGKIKITDNYAAFNTGLVNNLYEPIYALFGKNRIPNKQEWYFIEFCISGVGKAGKILASYFNPLPERAQFFRNQVELLYDTKAPEPQMNWNHIILDNLSRLPVEFLMENSPNGFELQDTQEMDAVVRKEYYEALAWAIEQDSKKFRSIKNRFSDSLSLALKKVQWNFRTAIPIYYPASNRLSLLLPLSLLDDEIIDVALVTERTPSGSYLGHTILPLNWAYNNARLIARPDNNWLIAEDIETGKATDATTSDDSGYSSDD